MAQSLDQENARQSGIASVFSLIDSRAFLAIVAFALYWAWIFACYWGGSLDGLYDGLYTGGEALWMIDRLLGLAAQAIGFAGIAVLWKFFTSPKGQSVLTAFVILCAPLSALGMLLVHMGIDVAPSISMVFFFLFGCSHACLFTKIGLLLDDLNGRALSIVLAFAILLSGALYAFILNLPDVMQSVTLMTFPWIACVVVVIARPKRVGGRQAPETEQTSGDRVGRQVGDKQAGDARSVEVKPADAGPTDGGQTDQGPALREFRHFFIQLLLYSIVFASVHILMDSFESALSTASIMGVAILLTGATMLVFSIVVSRYMPAGSLLWYLLPVMAFGLLPLSLVDGFGRAACYLLIAFGFTCFDMLSVYQLTGLIKFHNLPVIRYFALGRFANALGMALGWLFASLLISLTSTQGRAIDYMSIILIALLVLMLVFMQRPHGLTKAAAPDDQGQTRMQRPWKECCLEICAQFGLSPREAEVFMLLARGRTAKMTAEKLFISESTAKSHIYHIYQKTGFHSQQELIDLVETRYRSDNDGNVQSF